MMEGALLLSLSPDLGIDQITATTTHLIVHLVSTQQASHCPLCGHASEHVHSRYRRGVADVPCGSKPVSLSLQVRKFFCRNPRCPRKIFTERLPELVQPWARMTNRLRSALQALGLATGGEGGAELARQHRDAGSAHDVAAGHAHHVNSGRRNRSCAGNR
jgi:hypothetical protein